MNNTQLLLPMFVLLAWSMVMWAWMFAVRVPATLRARMRLDPNQVRGAQMNELPASVRWKADNYNHLMEQPTIFYAAILGLCVLGGFSGLDIILAWMYVVLRIIHSLIQALINNIMWRFAVFMLSSIVLVAIIIRAFILFSNL